MKTRDINKKLLKISEGLLDEEIERTSMPPIENHKICLAYGRRLAAAYSLDRNFILACLNFMDVKIGEAFLNNKSKEHAQMSLEATLEAIKPLALGENIIQKLSDCVLSHHGKKKYPNIEAEICANADCFKFLHPRGVFAFIHALGKRETGFDKTLEYAKQKLDEKMAIVSLPEAKKEAENYYQSFSKLLSCAADFNGEEK